MNRLLLSSTLIVLVALTAVRAGTSELNKRVVDYAESQRGKQVGRGECTDLASAALKAAGAQPRDGADAPRQGDYVWGQLVFGQDAGGKPTGKWVDVKPGDIMQFRDVKLEGRQGQGFYVMNMPHHTAIITKVEPAQVVRVLHQNNGNSRVVMPSTLNFGDMKGGYYRIYRPLAAE